MEGINICLVILVECVFNDVHWVTIDEDNGDFGNNCWDTGTVGINVCYGLADLDSGNGRDRGFLCCLSVLVLNQTEDG